MLKISLVVLAGFCVVGPAFAQIDTPVAQRTAETGHEGYYYPGLSSTEIYVARAQPLSDSDRRRRVLFTVALAQEGVTRGLPEVAIYAKGDQAEKLIISAMTADRITTLYQARAYLAHLTLLARATPVFREMGVEDSFTFLDLLAMLGFNEVTISDGMTYAHQVSIR